MRRVWNLLYWLTPPGLCFALNWPGFRSWFQQDDFAWLGLPLTYHGIRDLPRILFAPMAQGTIRPVSERAFFLAGNLLFGPWQAPYHAAVMLTQLAAIVLLAAVTRRLTGSRAAAFLAAAFWAVNSALTVPLAWISAYNQVLCGFFALAGIYCLLRHAETGQRRWFFAQLGAFLLGLGSLETMAVYPVLAAACAWCCVRSYLRRTAPLFAISAAYLAIHYAVAPYQSADPDYVLHFDLSIFRTLARYWHTALGPGGLRQFFPGLSLGLLGAFTAAGTLALVGFAWRDARQGRRTALFGLIWFACTIAPVLALRDHVFAYYLVVPTAGLAVTAGAAVAWAAGRPRWRAVGVVLAGIYLVCGAVEARLGSEAWRDRSFRVRTVVLGAYRARQLHPDKAIVLTGIDPDLYWASVANYPFRVYGVYGVYLDPASEERIGSHPGRRQASEFVLPGEVLRATLDDGHAVVYEIERHRLRAVTMTYRLKARDAWTDADPARVDVGNSLFSGQLGSSWYRIEDGRRWMPQIATVRLAGPRTAGERLRVDGWCPREQLQKGPLRVNLAVDGIALPEAAMVRAPGAFSAALKLPDAVVGRRSVEVAIAVERTFTAPGDRRELGLIFGTFEIRP